MRIDLTETPSNPADQSAAYYVADWINTGDGTISGDLYDEDDNQVAHRRVYSYTGAGKNIPFADLSEAQIDHLTGEAVNPEWIYPQPVEGP